MKKIVRLTEQDLVRLVNRVINEQADLNNTDLLGNKVISSSIINDVGYRIPCINKEFNSSVFKITDRKILSKFQGKSSSSPVLSNKNVILINKTNISLPDKKFGTATIIANGNVVNTLSLDRTSIGSELYIITDVVMSAVNQDESKFKIGWVLCNDGLYLYDIVNEQLQKQGK